MPIRVIAGLVIVGDRETSLDPSDGLERFCQTEVQHLDRAVRSHFDVGGFEVAMDDAVLMRGVEGVGDLSGDRQRFVERKWPTGDAVR